MLNIQRRHLGVAILILFVLAAVGALFYEISLQPKQEVGAWVVVPATIPAGVVLQANQVQRILVPQTQQNYVWSSDPVGDTTAHQLRAGDEIRSDDVVSGSMAEVSLKFTSPPLVAGDTVDIYAVVATAIGASPSPTPSTSGTTAVPEGVELVGPHLTVVTVSGDGGSVLVTAKNEPLWLALSASGQPLVAALVNSNSARVPIGSDPQTALQELSGITPTASPAVVATPTPTPTPTPSS